MPPMSESMIAYPLQLPSAYRCKVLWRAQLLILIGVVFELLMIGIGAFNARVAVILLIALVFIAVSLWLTWRQHYNISAYLLLLMVLALASGLAFSGQGIHDIALLIYPANLVLGGLLLRSRDYWILTAATLLMVVVLGVVEALQWIQPTIKFIGVLRIRFEVLTLSVILLLIAVMVHMLVDGISMFFAETQQKSQTLEVLYQKIQAEVDERRSAQQALQSLNDELEQRIQARTQELQNSNRELESFSYSVSHDLRAPLRTIHGFASAIKDDYGEQLKGEGNQLLERVLGAALRMDNLISDLLRFAQISRQSLRDESVVMQSLVDEVFAELKEQHNYKGELQCQTLPECRGDRALLRQVWVNLLGNAIKFSRQQSEPFITVTVQQTEKRWLFSVRDNGVGFDMQFRDKLFGVFHRLHAREQFEGTGIGLALCRRIIERHGGQIDAHSEVGKGATFEFSLPI